jgi:AcrR family transcriptional regulator
MKTTVDSILDAAARCFHRDSIDTVTMSDVIVESGVARTTVYRHFATKDDIISQLVLRDIDSLVLELVNVSARHDGKTLDEELLAILYFTVTEISRRPLMAELFSQDPMRVNRLGLTHEAVVKYSQAGTKPMFRRLKSAGRLRNGVTLAEFSDWCRRIIMSFVGSPHSFLGKPAKLKKYLRNYVVPSLLADD